MALKSAGASPSLRFSVFYAAFFLQIGIALPFWPMVLASRALSPSEIGFVLAAAPLIRMLAGPLLGFASDRYRLGRRFLFALAALSALGLSGFGLVEGFWPIFALTLFVAPLYPSIMPIVDSHALQQSERGVLDFGRVRLWGSMGFVIANLCGGALIVGADPGLILGLVIGATVLGALATPALPSLDGPLTTDAAKPDWSMAGALLRRPAFLAVALIAGSIQSSHALLYSFGSLEWRAQGLDETSIGLLWAAGVMAEVVLLSQTTRLIRRFGARGLLVLAGAACILRWSAMAFSPPLEILFPLQLLHAFTFAATYVAGIHLVQEVAPRNLVATAQALYAAIAAGVLFSSATAVSGVLYGAFGSTAYAAPALLSGVCAAAAVILLRRGAPAVSPTAPGPAEP